MVRRWSPASKLFAALAAISGLAAFVVVNGYARKVEALAPALGEPVAVVVAAVDLPRGTVLGPEMLRTATYPSRFAPPGTLRRPEEAAGRTLLAGLAAGEPVTATRLGPARAGPIASLVPEGLRAFAIASALPPGALRPGDRVDVLATFAGGRPHTETVASGLEVLLVLGEGGLAAASAAGVTADAVGLAGGPVLVLLVTPGQAERLAYARAFADLAVSVAGAEGGDG